MPGQLLRFELEIGQFNDKVSTVQKKRNGLSISSDEFGLDRSSSTVRPLMDLGLSEDDLGNRNQEQ